MIISNSKRFIFVHIPKTGGTSIAKALAPTLRWNDIICGGTPYGEKVGPLYSAQYGMWKHSPGSEIRRVVGTDIWAQYFAFGFVRNPYDRMRSLYTYAGKLVQRQGWRLYLRHLLPKQSLWTWGFVQAYLNSSNFSDFIRHPGLADASVARPMIEYLADGDTLLVDYVGRLEDLQSGFREISAQIRLDAISIPAENRSYAEAELGRYYHSQEDYDCVYERYREDFEVFGYPRAPVQRG